MILTKLQEALVEIEAQRKSLDQVERQLRAMISTLGGAPQFTSLIDPGPLYSSRIPAPKETRDGIDDVAEILRLAGKPLHITAIAKLLSERKGTKVLRTAIEPGLNRHIAKTKVPRIAKFAPSTYGIPEWKAAQIAPTLTQMAS